MMVHAAACWRLMMLMKMNETYWKVVMHAAVCYGRLKMNYYGQCSNSWRQHADLVADDGGNNGDDEPYVDGADRQHSHRRRWRCRRHRCRGRSSSVAIVKQTRSLERKLTLSSRKQQWSILLFSRLNQGVNMTFLLINSRSAVIYICSVCMYASVCQALVRVREHALMLTWAKIAVSSMTPLSASLFF